MDVSDHKGVSYNKNITKNKWSYDFGPTIRTSQKINGRMTLVKIHVRVGL